MNCITYCWNTYRRRLLKQWARISSRVAMKQDTRPFAASMDFEGEKVSAISFIDKKKAATVSILLPTEQ